MIPLQVAAGNTGNNMSACASQTPASPTTNNNESDLKNVAFSDNFELDEDVKEKIKKNIEWAKGQPVRDKKAAEQDARDDKEKIVLMSKFSPLPYYRKLLSRGNKFLYDKFKRFWRYDYNTGLWREDAEEYIRNQLRVELMGEEQQRTTYVNEVVSYIRDNSYDGDKETELSSFIIPFENTLVDIRTGQLIDFDCEQFVTSKIPIKIDPKRWNSCPVIDKFFSDCVGEVHKTILYELTAYCLFREYPYEKIFFLIGGGQNGKSTYLEMLRAFLGRDNVSNVSPHDLVKDKFALGALWNKFANISSEISYETLQNVEKLKAITSDSVDVERKFKERFTAKLYAKQIYATNQLPIVTDKTYAWYRRVYLIEFPNKVENPDRFLIKKLTTKEELSGLAWKSIQVLKYFYENNQTFTFDIDVDKITQIYEDMSNPLSKFLRENTSDDGDGRIFKFEFYEKFSQWLRDNKFRVWNEKELSVFMKSKYDDGKCSYQTENGELKRYNAWLGLVWSVHRVPDVRGLLNNIYIYSIINKNHDMLDKGDTNNSEKSKNASIEPKNIEFEALEDLSLLILKSGEPQEFHLKKDVLFNFFDLGDEASRVSSILLKENKIKPSTTTDPSLVNGVNAVNVVNVNSPTKKP